MNPNRGDTSLIRATAVGLLEQRNALFFPIFFSPSMFPTSPTNMYQSSILTALCLLIPYTVSQSTSVSTGSTPTSQPPDFAGQDTPFRVVPTGTDIPLAPKGNLSVQNAIGTWLYGYNGCKQFRTYFGCLPFLSWSMMRNQHIQTCNSPNF